MMKDKDKEALLLVGKRIKAFREIHDISQDRLAFDANISSSQISKIERGKNSASISNISSICGVFNITLNEFFSEINHPLPKKKNPKKK
jgi:transcriptional regulator with XRE-family HTH domain